jgi:hypothetical protein
VSFRALVRSWNGVVRIIGREHTGSPHAGRPGSWFAGY